MAHLGARYRRARRLTLQDRKSTRLNSSHITSSYAVFCLQKNIFRSTEQHIGANEEDTSGPTRHSLRSQPLPKNRSSPSRAPTACSHPPRIQSLSLVA